MEMNIDKKCYGQKYKPMTVTATNCCTANTANLSIDVREIKVSVIRGKVTCDKIASGNVGGALIIARRTNIIGNDKLFYAIADDNGYYAILVEPGDYEVAAFQSCNSYGDEKEPCNKCNCS